ncbi:hypothetical protein J1N35_038255 [Gossypium stocksii]|uniref:Uncharacterized protein n=1 Tax=Gossypium stocksii TaxID=47602 RepID=A0A9D3ULQ1_9ROSI|nr:hypothetical protein J1N35_038255 [Gossypium stocksii]
MSRKSVTQFGIGTISRVSILKGEDFSDLDLNEVQDDINDEGTSDDDNVYAPPLRTSTHGIVIQNDTSTHMLSINHDVAHAFEFPKYPDIIPSY